MQITSVVRDLKVQRAKVAAELDQLDRAISALSGVSSNGVANVGRARRVMSPAARRRIAAAQKARWARWRRSQKAA